MFWGGLGCFHGPPVRTYISTSGKSKKGKKEYLLNSGGNLVCSAVNMNQIGFYEFYSMKWAGFVYASSCSVNVTSIGFTKIQVVN